MNITWPELGKQNTQAKKIYSGLSSVQLGLQIPIVLAGFRIPQKKVSQIPDSKRSNFPDSRIWITYTGQIYGLSMKKLKLMSSKILVQLP